jgi:hypothetical protein
MTDQHDPGQTARLVSDITRAYRQRAADPDTRPVTYQEAIGGNIVDQIGRYRELADRDVMARAIATLGARGTYQPSEHVNEEEFPPLTVPELLEMLALGEVIARYYRHPSHVDHAVRVGATWEEIAAATGTTAEETRAAYREWAEGQHQLHADVGLGLDDDQYATALELAGWED